MKKSVSNTKVYHHPFPFSLESGEVLPELRIAYTTYGNPNASLSNVVWVFHALTANADPTEWWPGLVGNKCLIDPGEYFIVCANVIGSCYGSTSPADFNLNSGERYGADFPSITIRDMVKAHQLLQKHLTIDRIYLGIGGSLGGQQLLEWAIQDPGLFEHICPLATNARHSPWGIAFNAAQRMAIEADPSFFSEFSEGGKKGLEAARAIAMLSYRTPQIYESTQQDGNEVVESFKADSYQRYQGQKLSKRFDARAYHVLSRAMDSHHVGRNRNTEERALAQITAKTLVIGLRSDLLFPVTEQSFLATHIGDAQLEIIDSPYGHDGFLVETEAIVRSLNKFLSKKLNQKSA